MFQWINITKFVSSAVLLRVFAMMVHMLRISEREKNNRQRFPMDLPFARAHLSTSTPKSFFRHTLGTAELIPLLLTSISGTALTRNHTFHWAKQPNLLCFRIAINWKSPYEHASLQEKEYRSHTWNVFISLRSIWISEIGQRWNVKKKKSILELSSTTQVLVKKHTLGRLRRACTVPGMGRDCDLVTTALMTKEK